MVVGRVRVLVEMDGGGYGVGSGGSGGQRGWWPRGLLGE